VIAPYYARRRAHRVSALSGNSPDHSDADAGTPATIGSVNRLVDVSTRDGGVGTDSHEGEEDRMSTMNTGETGSITGTPDKDYNIIWFVEACLSNVLRLEIYIQDAERQGDTELAEFFRRAQGESRKGAEQGKELLRTRLAR
jgi:hypothetical protein